MANTKENTNVFFEFLSRLTNEDIPEEERERAFYDRYNKLQERTNGELYDLLAQTSYPEKYKLFEQIRLLLLSVRLYSVIPDLINVNVTGFYHPSPEMIRWLQNRFLDEASDGSFLADVPTLLTRTGAEGAQMTAFSVGERIIEIDQEEYRELLLRGAHSENSAKRVELSGVMHLLHIRSARIPVGRALLIVPNDFTGHRKYDAALFGLCDELAFFCGGKKSTKLVASAISDKPQEKVRATGSGNDTVLREMLYGSNVKRLLVDGRKRMPDEQLPEEVNLGEFTASLQMLDSEEALAEQLERNTEGKQNFYHAIWLETLFSSLLWYLSERRKSLIDRFEAVNKDSLSEDSELKQLVLTLREELREQMDQSEALCNKFLRLCEEFGETLKELEALRNITEGPLSWNAHTISPDGMLAHFFRMCDFYRGPEGRKAQSVRDLEALCKTCADAQLATIIANDYFNRTSSHDNLEHLKAYASLNPFIVRVKLRHRSALGLYEEDCGALIDSASFLTSLSAEEQRMHGKYLLAHGDRSGARQELYEAMARGDRDAGECYHINFQADSERAEDAALFGVADAAYAIGMRYMEQWIENCKTDLSLYRSALKFLNIAAASNNMLSYFALSKLWFERGMYLGASSKDALDCFRTCLIAAQQPSGWHFDCSEHERMGIAFYYLGEYRTAMEHLRMADTPDSYFLQGQMYEDGIGIAKNRATALHRYASAASMGHPRAAAAHDRLSEQLEAERKMREASERRSYQSTHTTSNHSSSSGW